MPSCESKELISTKEAAENQEAWQHDESRHGIVAQPSDTGESPLGLLSSRAMQVRVGPGLQCSACHLYPTEPSCWPPAHRAPMSALCALAPSS